jgi:DNA-binding NtrC family response regulator
MFLRREVEIMAEAKVLIVDDEEEFSQALAERMRMRGLSVEIAGNGQEALEKVESGVFDAIVLDMVMPGMDGMETLKKLKEKKPEFQVILLTGHASLDKGVESIKMGAMDFLEKPADLESLTKKIKEARAKRLVLVEKAQEDYIKDILSKKGW